MTNRSLVFTLQTQLQTNWCWVANAASISLFYNPASGFTQCKVACETLGRADCCNSKVPSGCNIPYLLDEALSITDNLKQFIQKPIPLTEIITEIDHQWIVGVRIGWRSGGGHFVSIYGYNNLGANSFVYVADPIYGRSYMALIDFTENYLNDGNWTHTYLTKGKDSMLHFNKVDESMIERAMAMVSPDVVMDFDNLNDPQRESGLMGHDIYNINIDSLKGGNNISFDLVGTRFIKKDNHGDDFIFEFSGTDKKRDLSRIIFGDQYARNYYTVVESLRENFKNFKVDYNVAVVRLPSLKVEAVWLRKNDDMVDSYFIPLFTNDFLDAEIRYSIHEFFELLRENSSNSKLYDNDRMGG